MTNHANHDHPNTKAARAACRKATAVPETFVTIAEPVTIGSLTEGTHFLHPIFTGEIYRVVSSEFGYTRYAALGQPDDAFTELADSTLVRLP